MGRGHYRVTLADAIAAHDEALTYGGRDGVTSLDLIESALGRPYSGYHRAISRKAAALLQSMVGNHGFVDGNKRTAWLLIEVLVQRSGYRLDIDDDEPIDDLVVAVAAGQMGFDELHVWFKARLSKVEQGV
ncbi:type II toxin-antitoxin system death-on-curing family toxin [Ruegeria sp. HKCCD8929]|uniref:type II toxin-antitoxin system death-on-curing family toxin n=1 Tax=Ruegeria sp. HKCCD8929 TaxID=2683006 RepID=UPI0035301B9B